MEAVDALAWNALAGPAYPFLRHEFLLALEHTGCTTAATGWQPVHVLVEERNTTAEHPRLLACLPLYAKTHSMGEYVFDWSWADAYTRNGLDYYPKLVSAIPFTPCTGPRLLCVADADQGRLITDITRAIKDKAKQMQASSWHVLFPDNTQAPLFEAQGLLKRIGCQYQWFNQGYTSFEHYLATFNSRKRKNLRKEREKVRNAGISFSVLEGREVTPEQWGDFYRFYASTYLVRGRNPYLNPDFFKVLGEKMPDQLLLILAHHAGVPIAGALYFKGEDTLYGRYWGCTAEYQFLHFETCYYQGIDYCIAHAIARIDSGAQGEHKIQRGFTPVQTRSAHWIARPDFRNAVSEFLVEEERYILTYLEQASEHLPFRKDQPALELDEIPEIGL